MSNETVISEAISKALLNLLNAYPGLEGKNILFSSLDATYGIGLFPTSGAVLLSNVESITGKVTQTVLYPFTIVYRAAFKAEERKLSAKELLDNLGRWLERQEVNIDGKTYKVDAYPALAEGQKIKQIVRTNPAHLDTAYNDGVEDWAISLTMRYENIYNK